MHPSGLVLLAFTATFSGASATRKQYSSFMLDSIISREQGVTASAASTGLIELGLLQSALRKAASATSNQRQAAKWSQYLNQTIHRTGVLELLDNAHNDTLEPLDRLSVGNALLYDFERTSDQEELEAVLALRKSISLQPENKFGGLWYYVYPNWSYLDGMWSYAPFLTHYIVASAHNSALTPPKVTFSDVAHQLDLLWHHNLIKAPTGGHLLVHGYDATKTAVWANPVTGASPIVWDRSLGWYAMALVDTIEEMEHATALLSPTSKSGAANAKVVARLLNHLGVIARGIALAADPATGAWYQVMNPPAGADLALNFLESSGSAMFVYSLLKGVRLGYLKENDSHDRMNFTTVADKAYQYILKKFVVSNRNGTFDYNGTVEVCSLNSTASYEYYTGRSIQYNSLLGSASFVLASLEQEQHHS